MRSIAATPILILAGGRATRLAHLAQGTAKYLQPIASGKCFADVQLGWVANRGFKKVILSIGYLGEQIRNYCGDGSKYGLEISYLDDGPTAIGTGAAVRRALEALDDTSDGSLISQMAVMYGDTILNFDVEGFIADFEASHKLAGMTLFRNNLKGHACNCDLRGGLAVYNKKSPSPEWTYIDYGFLLFKRNALGYFPASVPLDLAEPLAEISRHEQLFGRAVQERFWEIGTPEALDDFRRAFANDVLSMARAIDARR